MNYLHFALAAQLICIPLVILLFKYLERIPASFLATALFVAVGGLSLVAGYKAFYFKSFAFWGAVQFVVFFALPIAAMRIIYPTQELGDLHLGPLSAAKLHGFSNLSFLVMMALTIVDLVRQYRHK